MTTQLVDGNNLMQDVVRKIREYGAFHESQTAYQSRAGQKDQAEAHASRSVAANELAAQLESLAPNLIESHAAGDRS